MCALYSLSWASSRYQAWYEDAPRATEAVLKMVGLTKYDVINFLANNDKSWEAVKAIRKMYRKLWCEPHVLLYPRIEYSTFVEHNVVQTWKHLQDRINRGLTVGKR